MSNINMSDDASQPAASDVPGYAYATGPNPADVEKNKVFAILAYLGLLFLVPLLAAKDSPFAMYHANQGLLLFIMSLVLGFIPFVNIVAFIVILIFMIMGIINAANGLMKPLPLIGGIKLIK